MGLPEAYKTWKEAADHIDVLRRQYTDIVQQFEIKSDSIDEVVEDADSKRKDVESALATANANLLSIASVLEDSRSRNKEIADSLTQVDTAVAQLSVATTELAQDRRKLVDLITKAEGSSKVIADLLQKATAATLFHAFDATQKSHADESKFWRASIIVSLLALLIINLIFVLSISTFDISYWLRKLVISSPVIYWLVLSTRRYSKAKRLQEEYAFKSAVSLSLEAYRDLLQKEAGKDTGKEVIPVLTEAVGNIFTSPSVSLSKHPHLDDKDLVETLVDTVSKLADKIKVV